MFRLGDRHKFLDLLYNLITNACKFTTMGTAPWTNKNSLLNNIFKNGRSCWNCKNNFIVQCTESGRVECFFCAHDLCIWHVLLLVNIRSMNHESTENSCLLYGSSDRCFFWLLGKKVAWFWSTFFWALQTVGIVQVQIFKHLWDDSIRKVSRSTTNPFDDSHNLKVTISAEHVNESEELELRIADTGISPAWLLSYFSFLADWT